METVMPNNPPDVESLRVYLTLPCCHMFDDPSNYRNVICPFGKALMSLSSTPAKVIGKSVAKEQVWLLLLVFYTVK